MDKKSKIFSLVFSLVLVGTVGATYYKYFISRNFYLEGEASCDPENEKCFISECNPDEDSECPQDELERISYYKLSTKNAYLVPSCDSNDENCHPMDCLAGQDCEETACDEELAKAQETECSDPEEYRKQLEEQKASEEENCDGDSCEVTTQEEGNDNASVEDNSAGVNTSDLQPQN